MKKKVQEEITNTHGQTWRLICRRNFKIQIDRWYNCSMFCESCSNLILPNKLLSSKINSPTIKNLKFKILFYATQRLVSITTSLLRLHHTIQLKQKHNKWYDMTSGIFFLERFLCQTSWLIIFFQQICKLWMVQIYFNFFLNFQVFKILYWYASNICWRILQLCFFWMENKSIMFMLNVVMKF